MGGALWDVGRGDPGTGEGRNAGERTLFLPDVSLMRVQLWHGEHEAEAMQFRFWRIYEQASRLP
jgi:hypothetical protein